MATNLNEAQLLTESGSQIIKNYMKTQEQNNDWQKNNTSPKTTP